MNVELPEALTPLLRQIGALAAARGMAAYAVGGCVRDWLRQDAGLVDVDITVEGDGVVLAEALAAATGGGCRSHAQFGTATVTWPAGRGGLSGVDVATCRQETYARPAAYPRVRAGTIGQDLARRDFSINATAISLTPAAWGTLLDPFDGAADLLQRRVLRVLHARSFWDDPSRILRGIRFLHRFALRWEAQTRHWLEAAVADGALGWLNAGRLEKELARMAEEPDPARCLATLAALLADAA